ncbi:DUF1015 domain-containing protein [Robertkochia marina]|uniref:DUF1015 domain-containing protein n=1 Tax=Robertkochia marina TaxID=1227945 RepID=A0A4S3M2T3_9FLAO|nr:DUF1015 domain-containing protein [Robertkochia marina]THD67795.1 DUF1015 domain-containing protein [Robertkochia marina]TRZ41730.1 DUF1015 domain-containing protein [Robertkochia marina]
MFLINPFRAVIPVPDKVAHVVTRDLRSYSPEELQAILKYNPYSFLQVINPGHRYNKEVTGEDRNILVRNRYLEFVQEKVLVKDDQQALFLYQLDHDTLSCMGLLGNLHLSHYEKSRVKPHEKTLKARVEIFQDYLRTTRIQTDPVLLVHDDDSTLQEYLEKLRANEPCLNFTTPDKQKHRLWRITDQTAIERISNYLEKMNTIYIADGHHRISSSAKMYKESTQDGHQDSAYVMSLFAAASQVRISGFTRLVHDLNGLSKADFLIALDRFFIVEEKVSQHLEPTNPLEFTMYLDGGFYSLTLRDQFLKDHPLKDLPPNILQRTVLKPILNIKSMRRSKRITYIHSLNGELKMKNLIDEGLYEVGFTHFPVSFEQLKAVADKGLRMPPKSTYIEPKLKSALTVFEF